MLSGSDARTCFRIIFIDWCPKSETEAVAVGIVLEVAQKERGCATDCHSNSLLTASWLVRRFFVALAVWLKYGAEKVPSFFPTGFKWWFV